MSDNGWILLNEPDDDSTINGYNEHFDKLVDECIEKGREKAKRNMKRARAEMARALMKEEPCTKKTKKSLNEILWAKPSSKKRKNNSKNSQS